MEIVQRLIASGAKVDEKSANCRTTLHVVCYLGRLEIGENCFSHSGLTKAVFFLFS